MYRDESETLLDGGHSHNFATAFLRNLRCSTVMSINVWVCQTVKNRFRGQGQGWGHFFLPTRVQPILSYYTFALFSIKNIHF